MKKLFILVLCLLLAVPAYADVAYEPPITDFYEKNRALCTNVERLYYTNGQEGYITLQKAPDGLKTRYITNGEKVEVFCTYEDWGMVTFLNGTELDTPGWVPMSELYLIYDGISFEEEYSHRFGSYSGTLTLPEGEEGFYVYEYPGAPDPYEYTFKEEDPDYGFQESFTDSEGRLWAFIRYYRGLRDKWVCIDDPCSIIQPFGGDPNLALIEAETPSQREESPVIVPAEEPPAVVFNPMPVVAVALVAAAITAAIVLLAVCYRKKKEG
ncbi:MAG: hypothetical protein IJ043_05070 [Clostridia bacterium]|nr:hypothetical protein [Clostridia bacterium]